MERTESSSSKMKVDMADGAEDEIKLIDISSEDDFLIGPSFRGNFEGLRLSVAFDGGNVSEGVPPSEKGLAFNTFIEGKYEYNCRNSLAWDTAFFTSAGVLDPEELSLVNRGYRRSNCTQLPGIGENIQESDSTVDRNASSLQRLESVLFEDVRTVQKSRNKLINEADLKSMGGPRKMLKSVPVTRGQTRNVMDLQHTARSRELRSSARKPLKSSSLPAVFLTPSKRCSPGANGRIEAKVSKPGLSQMTAKRPCLGVSSSLSSCSSSSVTFSSPPRTACSETATSSSCGITGRSPSTSVRRKVDSRKDGQSCSVSLNTPHRSSALASMSKSQISSNSTGMATPKLSSYDSPSSPMILWSSVSSTASSTTNDGFAVSEAKHDPTPNTVVLLVSPPTAMSFSTTPNRKASACLNNGIRTSGHNARSSSKSSSALSRSVPNTYKPSGLRVPTSKYGLFDEERSCSSDKVLQFDSGLSEVSAINRNAGNFTVAEYRKQCKLPSSGSSKEARSNIVAGKTGNLLHVSCTNPMNSRLPASKSCPPRVPSKPRAKNNNEIAHDKENSLRVKHEVDDLSRNLELIRLHGDVVIELERKKGAPNSASLGKEARTISKNGWYSLPANMEMEPSPRTPLAVKDPLNNRSGLFEVTPRLQNSE